MRPVATLMHAADFGTAVTQLPHALATHVQHAPHVPLVLMIQVLAFQSCVVPVHPAQTHVVMTSIDLPRGCYPGKAGKEGEADPPGPVPGPLRPRPPAR